MRSVVESRKLPNWVSLPCDRASAPSRMSRMLPTMNATVAQTKCSS